jgi:sporulation protein YabP
MQEIIKEEKVKALEVNDIVSKAHKLSLTNREDLKITGVTKVYNANEKQINLDIGGTSLTIEGKELEVTKLDLSNSHVEIFGIIGVIKYDSAKHNQEKTYLKGCLNKICFTKH